MTDETTIPKAWITKYALGGLVIVMKDAKADAVTGKMPPQKELDWDDTLYPDEWHETEADAIAAVERMKAGKISYLESELARTRALDPAKVVREAK